METITEIDFDLWSHAESLYLQDLDDKFFDLLDKEFERVTLKLEQWQKLTEHDKIILRDKIKYWLWNQKQKTYLQKTY